MNRRNIFIILGSVFLILFTFFSWSVKRGAFQNIDFAFTVKVQDMIDKSPRLRLSRMVGEVMEGSTFLASPEISIIFILVITTIIFIKNKKNRWLTLAIPILFVFLVLAEIYGKSVVHHPAPPFFMIKNPTTVFPKYYINDEFSYPSGHAARAVFLAMIISYLFFHTSYLTRKRMLLGSVLVCIGYVGLVAISRIYLGHHWLSDIIGGLFLGAGCGMLGIGIGLFWRNHIWTQ